MMTGLDGRDDERKAAITVTRDPTYFLQWDSIILKVENVLFKIPRHHLLRHSQHLKNKFSSAPLSAREFSEADPFVVDSNITAMEFRHFLRIILPSMTEDPETFWTTRDPPSVSKDEWISVLKVSTLWYCLSLRSLAIRKVSLTGVEKIVLGRKYFISSWVLDGYTTVVENRTITDGQMEELGPATSFKLMRIISDIQMGHSAARSAAQTIGETFRWELFQISEAEGAYSSIPISRSKRPSPIIKRT